VPKRSGWHLGQLTDSIQKRLGPTATMWLDCLLASSKCRLAFSNKLKRSDIQEGSESRRRPLLTLSVAVPKNENSRAVRKARDSCRSNVMSIKSNEDNSDEAEGKSLSRFRCITIVL
jgi:hypothetical protein